MNYDHLLPPERPRGYKPPHPTDLDCYPQLDKNFKSLKHHPLGLLGVTQILIGVAGANPLCVAQGVTFLIMDKIYD